MKAEVRTGGMSWTGFGTLLLWQVCMATLTADASVPLLVQEDAGVRRDGEIVTSGVPFPIGMLKGTEPLRLVDEHGKDVPLQARVSATWRDGSVKWALLDFPLDVAPNGSRHLALQAGETGNRAAPGAKVLLQETENVIVGTTGPLRLTVGKKDANILQSVFFDRNHDGKFDESEKVAGGLEITLTLSNLSGDRVLRALLPTDVKIEENGPERGVVKLCGWLNDEASPGVQPWMQYLLRVQARAGSAALHAQLTLVNLSPNKGLSLVKRFGVKVNMAGLNAGGSTKASGLIGGDSKTHSAPLVPGARLELSQLAEGEFKVRGTSREVHGVRAPGWMAWKGQRAGILVAVRDFWQQFPKALRVEETGPAVELYPGEASEPFDWDQGLAKTHELLLDFDGGEISSEAADSRVTAFGQPLFAVASSGWYCDSKVFGDLAPFSFDLFPDYETLVEAGGDKLIQSMATGIRNWGDLYYGGPYKGKNSFMNLEYDVPHNFLVQYARSGQRKYLDAARRMARHQADIDVNHFTGWQWKHSPRHTEIQAEFGHTFTRGLLEHYFLTGERRSFEAAVELGDYFAKEFRNPRTLGNERQIGWGLISLLPVYEATWHQKYLDTVHTALDRLIAGQDATGRFKIRYDNRNPFMNGVAATGLIYVERATGDSRIAEAALRTIRRTKGFIPEMCGRTLEALVWAYERTKDPDYLDMVKITYEATQARALAWRTMDLGGATIFTVHALPWLESTGLACRPDEPLGLTPEQFDSGNGLYVHHLPNSEGDLYLRHVGREPLKLVLIRKGAWKGPGEAKLFDPLGALVANLSFPAEAVTIQRRALAAPKAQAGDYLLKLRSPPVPGDRGPLITWDIATAQPTPTVMMTPRFEGLQFITPRLFTVPKGTATKIELTLVGEGEGFKKAVLYDPSGRAAAVLARFVDLGDKGRYEYTLSAPVADTQREGLWSLVLQDVALTAANGLSPYFAASAQSFFRPDR